MQSIAYEKNHIAIVECLLKVPNIDITQIVWILIARSIVLNNPILSNIFETKRPAETNPRPKHYAIIPIYSSL